MFEAMRVLGSATAGLVIGWLGAFRADQPFGWKVMRMSWSILGLAAPYVSLAVVISGVEAGIAALVGTLVGAVAYCSFRLKLAKRERGELR
jgi:hypothetical protein